MKSIVLSDREEVRNIEAELKHDFVIDVLDNTGIPENVIKECFPEGGYKNFDVEHKIKLRKHLKNFDVNVIDDLDGGIKIFVGKDLVAEWKKCHFILKKDLKKIDPAQKIYVEIHIDFWTIFE